MSTALTIRNLDEAVLRELQAEADRRGIGVDAAAGELLKERLMTGLAVQDQPENRSIESLAGTWTAEEAVEFLKRIGDFERIDPQLWH